jgi:hypothetical protein
MRRAIVHQRHGRLYHARVVYTHLVKRSPKYDAAWIMWSELEREIGRVAGTGCFIGSRDVLLAACQHVEDPQLMYELLATLHLEHDLDSAAFVFIRELMVRWPKQAHVRVFLVWAHTKNARKSHRSTPP